MKTDPRGEEVISPLVNPEDLTPVFPPLEGDVVADAAVIGGGLSGVLCARYLQREGLDTVLLTQGAVGDGETACCDGICIGDAGVPLSRLIPAMGKDRAAEWVRACAAAPAALEKTMSEIGSRCDFKRQSVFYSAVSEDGAQALENEFRLRYHLGTPYRKWDRDDCAARVSFPAAVGFSVAGGGAVFRPVRFCRDAASDLSVHGGRVFENTKVTGVETAEGERLCCRTSVGAVYARRVVDARGVSALKNRPVPGRRGRILSILTEPVSTFAGWHDRELLYFWETGQTAGVLGDRIVYTDGNALHLSLPGRTGMFPSFLSGTRYRKMTQDLSERFIGIPNLRRAAGFARQTVFTPTGLPCMGQDRTWKGLYYLYPFGAGGVAASVCGARLVARWCREGAAGPACFAL